MRRSWVGVLCAAGLVVANSGWAQSAIRISCYDANEGATVMVNGEAKGACPVDVFVGAGQVRLRAVKATDASHEQVWERTLQIGSDTVQRIEVELGTPRLTAAAAQEKARQEAQRAQTAAQLQLSAARGGDPTAMAGMIERYEAGNGVPRDLAQADFWRTTLARTKAAASLAAAQKGDVAAMDDLVQRFTTGAGVAVDPAQAQFWQQQAAKAREQSAQAAKRAQLQAEKDQISFIGTTSELITNANTAGKTGDSSATSVSTLGYTYIPVWLVLDLTSAPFRTTDLVRINGELDKLAARPAAFGQPDSMVAKALRARESKTGLVATTP